MDEGLQAIHEKLRRAERGLQDLAPGIEDFRNSKPHSVLRYNEPHGGNGFSGDIVYRAGPLRNREPFVAWAVATGEILYNVRSALEQTAYRLSRLHCAPCEPPGGIGFPIFTSESRFFRTDKHGVFRESSGAYLIRAMSHDAQQHILAIQPYQRRKQPENHPLALLDALMNHDKHQAPHIVASALEDSHIRPVNVRNATVRTKRRRLGAFVEGDEIMRVEVRRAGTNAHAEIELQFAVGIAFAKDGPAAGRPFPDTLLEIVEYVLKDVIRDRLEPLLS